MYLRVIVCLPRGDQALHQRFRQAAGVGISILSQTEFLAFPNLNTNDRSIFQQFADSVDVVGLDRTERALIDRIVSLRAQYRLKLPDAIIAATAIERRAVPITDDRQLQKLSAVNTSGTSAPTP